MLPKFSYVQPDSVREALSVLEDRNARIHSGGTDLIGCLHDGVFTTDEVVSLGGLAELRGISPAPDRGLKIGAMTTIAEVGADPTVRERFAALADAASVVASPQLRNQGTIGGNLCQKPRCWYYRGEFDCLRKGGELCYIVHPSDTAPALAALDAVCRVSGPSASRSVAVEKLHVPPSEDPQRETVLDDDEVITEIVLPPPAAGLRSSYRKVRARASWDFALAGAALALVFDGDNVTSARVFLSGAAPVPWRATGVEDAVQGTDLNDDAIAAAAEAAVAGAEPLAKNGYKIDLFRGLVTDQLEAIRG